MYWLLIIANLKNFCSSQKYMFYVAKKKCSDIGNIGNKSTDIVILGPIYRYPICRYRCISNNYHSKLRKHRFRFRNIVLSFLSSSPALSMVAASWTGVYFFQQIFSTCKNKFCCVTMFEVGGNTCNNAFQLAMQQCCAASCSNLLLVLLHLYHINSVFCVARK